MFTGRAPIVCIVLLLAATSALAQTDVEGPAYWAVTGVSPYDSLNLRVAPSAESRRIAKIPYNARGLKNYGCPNHVTFEQWKGMTQAQKDWAARSRWCQVEYKGMKGWVAGRFLKEDGAN
jgi:hypothetical protein